jgi:hypothetical protein
MSFLNQVRVASGFDQSLTDSDNIESINPSGNPLTIHIPSIGDVYCVVNSTPLYSEGQARLSPDAGQSFAGNQQVTYTQPRMHKDTLSYLRANLRGQVTCNVSLDSTTYSEWNARLTFQSDPLQNGWFTVRWIFTLIEAL